MYNVCERRLGQLARYIEGQWPVCVTPMWKNEIYWEMGQKSNGNECDVRNDIVYSVMTCVKIDDQYWDRDLKWLIVNDSNIIMEERLLLDFYMKE